MAQITIREFRISERAVEKFWAHGIARHQIDEVPLIGDRSRQPWPLYRDPGGSHRRSRGVVSDHRVVLQAR